jgi:hypothetical protein
MTAPTLAPVINLFTRQRGPAPLIRTRLPEPTPTIFFGPDWWTHPLWCDRSCIGGHTYKSPAGWTATAPREHCADTYRQTLTDAGDSNEAGLAAGVTAAEFRDEGFMDGVAVRLELNDEHVSLTADDAEAYANAVLAAVALARQALPTVTRPQSA